MAENNNLLVLRLEGMLQSWGEASKWDNRGSASMPTKSGIVGLLGCAMGLERGDPALLELYNSITVAVRADRAGAAFIDFQTVTGSPMMAASGKRRSTGDTIITPRTYYQDAAFTVFIETAENLRIKLVDALKNPKWCLYLGRKSCVPCRPVLECECATYEDLLTAVREYPLAARADKAITYECENGFDETSISVIRPDALSSKPRSFQGRQVWRNTMEG